MSEEEEEREKDNLPVLRVPALVLSRWFFAALGVLLDMKTLKDDWYVVIKPYKCTVSEIRRDFFVLAYIACLSYPYIYRVYRLYDNPCMECILTISPVPPPCLSMLTVWNHSEISLSRQNPIVRPNSQCYVKENTPKDQASC